MYLQHFGLREAPFAITPDPRYLYLSQRHREALAHLLYGIGEGGGFVQLTGEVGTGKTTLCRCLLEQLPSNTEVALILNPRVTALELVAAICDELRLDYPAGTASIKVLVDALNKHLLQAHADGRGTVVIIDEAQNLDREVLEQVRLLTNLETPQEKLLQIILIGQPELLTLLQRPELRQLAQRITARYHLTPLSGEETRAYIRHRMAVSDAHDDVFTEGAIRRVYALSAGIPRLINVICDRALLGAYATDRRSVDSATVQRAAAEALGRPLRGRHVRPWLWEPAVVGGIAAAWLWFPVGELLGTYRPLETAASPSKAAPSSAPETPGAAELSDLELAEALPEPPTRAASDPESAGAGRTANVSPPLAQVLAEAPATADRSSAFRSVFTQWGLNYKGITGATGCEMARSQGLQCSFREGDWDTLRKLNRPAVLNLTTPAGDDIYAAVTRMEGNRVTLQVAGGQYTFRADDLDPYWSGRFILLWKPPAIGTRLIGPGVRGRPVRWLRERFQRIDHGALPTADADAYDTALRERVVAFQHRHGLAPDGVVGEQTLIALGNVTGEPPHPALASR
jgi:general secretion pathway protein A